MFTQGQEVVVTVPERYRRQGDLTRCKVLVDNA